MHVISGATGRVGSAVADRLLTAGQPVRVLVRREEAAEHWRSRGAEAVVVDLRESERLAEALEGARSFFALMPFDLTVADLDAYAGDVVDSVAAAVRVARTPHTVMLSSGGADLPAGTGPIVGLHMMEEALKTTGTTLTALRSGHFQEKFTDVLDAARHEGVFPVFAASADTPIPMVATRDIAEIAVRELLAGPSVTEAVDIVGPSFTEREVAEELGRSLGRELTVVTVPEAGWEGAFVEAGFAPHIAASLADLYRADQRGDLDPRGDRSVEAPTRLPETVDRVLASLREGDRPGA